MLTLTAQDRKLVWEENFDGDELNEKVWNFNRGNGCPNLCGWGNAEKQIYTKKNHKVANGHLTIELRKEKSSLNMDILKPEQNYRKVKAYGQLFGCWVKMFQESVGLLVVRLMF